MADTRPTARALMALELLQSTPGITADRLAARLGVSGRAARRYVAVLREAGVPVESTSGPYGGYRVGRGVRVPPMVFSAAEALALVMAVLEGRRGTPDPTDPQETALAKIIRVLPAQVAEPVEAVRRVSAVDPDREAATPDPATTAALVQSCSAGRRLRVRYAVDPGVELAMDVDPWAVVLRHGRWYLLCWSHTKDARRVLRVDKVVGVDVLAETFVPPAGLDAARTLEEHLSQGWSLTVDVLVEAPLAAVAAWLPRSLGRLEEVDPARTRLLASTDDPDWYARQLTLLRAPFEVVQPPQLRDAVLDIGARLVGAGAGASESSAGAASVGGASAGTASAGTASAGSA